MTTNSTSDVPEPTWIAGELLPCPLCGSTALHLRDIAGWELDCLNCELSLVLADDPSKKGLIHRWNTRPDQRVHQQGDGDDDYSEAATGLCICGRPWPTTRAHSPVVDDERETK